MTSPVLVLSAIVISYNTREMTLRCLATLCASLEGVPSEVWVVDNASTDGSVEAIRAAFPEVRVIPNQQNAGFGAANNQGMKVACGEFFLLLNSDAFPQREAVRKLIAHLAAHPEAAAVGPRLLNEDGTLQRSCHRFPSPQRAWLENLGVCALLPEHPVLGDYRRWEHHQERSVDFVIGACMLVRRSVYEQIGGFDESFFMYAEETDWQRRMWAAGWKVDFTPQAEVVHLGGASGREEVARINRHFFESRDLYERKYYGIPGLVLTRLAIALGCALRFIVWSIVALGWPARRQAARGRTSLMAWLLVRQLTHWPRTLFQAHVGEGSA